MTLFLEWNDWSDAKRMEAYFNLEARCREAERVIRRLCEPVPLGNGRQQFFDDTWAHCQAWLIGFEKETGKTMSELFDRIVDRDAQWKKEIINTETWPIADRRWLIGRVRELEAALKDWINQAGMYAHWSPERIQEAINQYFASETVGECSCGGKYPPHAPDCSIFVEAPTLKIKGE